MRTYTYTQYTLIWLLATTGLITYYIEHVKSAPLRSRVNHN